MNWDKDSPLARCQGETKRANAALADYAMMGPGRSLEKLRREYAKKYEPFLLAEVQQVDIKPASEKPPTRQLRTLAGWSMRYDWQKRVEAWESIKRAEAEEEWTRRRIELCQIEWDKARALLERAELMLKHPLVERTVNQGPSVDQDGKTIIEQTVIVKPVRWSAADIARYVETASKLMRLAAGMETERHDVTSGGEAITIAFTGNVNPKDV